MGHTISPTFFLLFASCYLRLATCEFSVLLATYDLLLASYDLRLVTCYFVPATQAAQSHVTRKGVK